MEEGGRELAVAEKIERRFLSSEIWECSADVEAGGRDRVHAHVETATLAEALGAAEEAAAEAVRCWDGDREDIGVSAELRRVAGGPCLFVRARGRSTRPGGGLDSPYRDLGAPLTLDGALSVLEAFCDHAERLWGAEDRPRPIVLRDRVSGEELMRLWYEPDLRPGQRVCLQGLDDEAEWGQSWYTAESVEDDGDTVLLVPSGPS